MVTDNYLISRRLVEALGKRWLKARGGGLRDVGAAGDRITSMRMKLTPVLNRVTVGRISSGRDRVGEGASPAREGRKGVES